MRRNCLTPFPLFYRTLQMTNIDRRDHDEEEEEEEYRQRCLDRAHDQMERLSLLNALEQRKDEVMEGRRARYDRV